MMNMQAQALEETKQLQVLKTELDLIKAKVQDVEESRQLLETEYQCLWSGSERGSLIIISDCLGE